jgi:IMP dehydrogenase
LCQDSLRSGIPITQTRIKYSGDVTSPVAGADSVMLGSFFAGTDESPEKPFSTRTGAKVYRGWAPEAMKVAAAPVGQEGAFFEGKLVPEGIEGRVPYKGSMEVMIPQLTGGLRAGMGYCGCHNIKELQTKTRFVRITTFGLKESHVHDVVVTKEAPNYRTEI